MPEKLPNIERPSLREIMQKPETSVPEILAAVVIVLVILLNVIVYWPSDVRKGAATTTDSAALQRTSVAQPR